MPDANYKHLESFVKLGTHFEPRRGEMSHHQSSCFHCLYDVKSFIHLYVLQFISANFKPRTHTTHNLHCADLNGPLHDHITTAYGVQRNSILINESRYFHVTEGLCPDIMHDLLEGCLQYETKELLKHFVLIKQKDFYIRRIKNARVEVFPYSYPDLLNKPSPIRYSLKQSGE